MQQEILAAYPSANLRVYAVWFNMFPGDSRNRWDGAGLVDPRVIHLWDDQKLVGSWFSAQLTHREEPTWDFYALYGPDATWTGDLPPALATGGTIIGRRDRLLAGVQQVLGTPPAR